MNNYYYNIFEYNSEFTYFLNKNIYLYLSDFNIQNKF